MQVYQAETHRCGFNKHPKLGLLGHTFSLLASCMMLFAIAVIFNFFQTSFAKGISTTANSYKTQQVIEMGDILSEGYIGTFGVQPITPTLKVQIQKENKIISKQIKGDWEVYSTKPPVKADYVSSIESVAKWKAKKTKQSYKKLTIQAGKAATFWAEFKNTGTEAWRSNTKNFVALNVTNPAGRTSPFQHSMWPLSYRPGVMKDTKIKPGKKMRVQVALQAPLTPGNYTESFALVAENLLWIPGGEVILNIEVLPGKQDFQGRLTKKSTNEITIEAGKAITFYAEFKNTGKRNWKNKGENYVALNVTEPAGRKSVFQDISWDEYYYRPTRLDQSKVKSGQTGRFTFILRAPDQPGDYIEKFQAVAENLTWIPGTDFSIPIHVTQRKNNPQGDDPFIQVGLYGTTGEVIISPMMGNADIKDYQWNIFDTINTNESVSLRYDAGTFIATAHGKTYTSSNHLKVCPQNITDPLKITNYENISGWNSEYNDNMFRGCIELHFNGEKGSPWVVENLPLDSYVSGIAEAGNENDADYLQTLMTAARTYALYHVTYPSKHAGEPFIVDTSSSDQVYRGYGFEQRAPNVAAAVAATAGKVVTYQGNLVVTPYFSQSDGRTRAWEEVWAGGPKGWLKSVDDPGCAGDTILGHGIGLSAKGARYFADQGKSWDWILKYYYTGIEITSWY